MKRLAFPITAAVDVVTEPTQVNAGMAQRCYNYECTTIRGARSIDGFSRTDGRLNWSLTGFGIGITSKTDSNPIGWVVGDKVTVTYDHGSFDCIVVQVTNDALPESQYIHSAIIVPLAALPDNFSPSNMATVSGGPILDTSISVPSYVSGQQTYSIFSATVTKVPGYLPRIPGLHFFNDRIYAIVDLTAIEITPANGQTITEGMPLSASVGGITFGKVLYVRTSDTAGRVIAEVADWATARAPILGGTVYTGVSTQVGVFNAYVNPKKAALHYCEYDGPGGWVRPNVGRILPYKESGTSSAWFLPYDRRVFSSQIDANELQDTGWIAADSYGEIGGGQSWSPATGTTELLAIDGAYVASTTLGSGASFTKQLRAKWSGTALRIPPGSVVRGVQIDIDALSSSATACTDHYVSIAKGEGLVGQNKATLSPFGLVIANRVYGANNDLWGLSLNSDEINSGNMSALFQIYQNAASQNVSIDRIRIKVFYQDQTRKAYVYDATKTPTDQEIEVIHVTVTEGTEAAHTRRGLLVLNSEKTVSDREKPWQFVPGQKIRTLAGGLGNEIAEVAADDEVILFDSSYELASQSVPSRYVFDTANPYGADDSDVFFVASGAGYALMYDQRYAIPIQTGLMEQYEKPRHVCWAGNFLVLGYGTGTLALSDVGNPLVFAGQASLAAEIGASDRVTGLLRMKGDSVGVFTEQTVFAIQGVPPRLNRVNISQSSGAIEYTVVDTGMPTYCDFQGVSSLAATERYGNFAAGRATWQSAPLWLERLQAPTQASTTPKGVVASVAIRNKRQYRTYFKDGYFHSLTLYDPQNEAATSVGQYYSDVNDRANTGIRLLALCSGTTSSGKDVAFASFDVDADSRQAYVFQLDTGTSFDGEDIYSSITLQANFLGLPLHNKKLNLVGVYGLAYGYADINMYASTQFELPVTGSNAYICDFGVSTSTSSTETRFRSVVEIGTDGEDFTIMFESQEASQKPHTLQSIIFDFTPLEVKR